MFRRGALLTVVCIIVNSAPAFAQDASTKIEPSVVFRGHQDIVYALALSPDGQFLVTGSFDHSVKTWQTATGREWKSYAGPQGHQKMVLCVAYSGDGNNIASGGADNTLKTWDAPGRNPFYILG